MVKGKLIEFDEQRFRELCDKGLSFEEIGRQFGAKATWACKKAKALGIKKERKPVKVTWNLTPNSTPEYLEDGVSRIVRKRNGIPLRFLETGDLSEARAYCAKYGVPRPDGDKAFRQYLESAAGRLQKRQVAVKPKKRRGGRKPKFTAEQLQEQFDNGCTVEEAAANLGCSTVTIWKRKKEWGLSNTAKKGRPRNTWTQLDKDELQKLCDQGLSIERIARELDVGITIVKRNIKEYGIERKSLKTKTPIDKEQLKELVESGMTQEKIAEKFGCYPNTVSRLAKKYGIKKPPKAVPEPSDQDPVVLPEDEPFKLNLTLRPETVRELNILLRKHEGKRPGEVVRIALHEQAKILRQEERKTWSGRAGKYKFIDGQWQKVKEDS